MCKITVICGLMILGVTFADSGLELYNSANDGNVADVEMAILEGTNINWQNEDRRRQTALMAASINNHREVVKLLVDAGAIIDQKDDSGKTALFHATWYNSTDVVPLLITHGANIIQDTHTTPVNIASFKGHLSILKMFINANANVNHVDSDGMVPLHWAAWGGNINTAKELIQNGADTTKKTTNEDWVPPMTPASLAREHGNLARELGYLERERVYAQLANLIDGKPHQATATTASANHLAFLIKVISREFFLTGSLMAVTTP